MTSSDNENIQGRKMHKDKIRSIPPVKMKIIYWFFGISIALPCDKNFHY